MSRIGKQPIILPDGVTVTIEGTRVKVNGPKGVLERTMPPMVEVELDDRTVTVQRVDDSRQARAMHGLSRTLVNNMVVGVSEGYRKQLEIVGVGYRAQLRSPSEIELALGFSHPVIVKAPDGIGFEAPSPTRLVVQGVDKELVGQVAANIRKIRKPEPYKGKGVRYEGEKVVRKVGKAGK
ncbi:50S ribosomal protein L6 [Ferrimicrobium acidiphilum]|uniref:Large ribosomal subunit protein uL6 n=1 Tax=Ferrimicrobium acidiphilum DSM 19497 TaxID=1121877 RepID=A0A0D8FYR3_9ACTN|nr:50S ribosomal protein L6 [Ferrimicrobium acidiphilum]KJE77722.1 50S ribosomal protein L6 [Ferrimicrobium acidiphilum DSM 19497]MCL5053795.1 50S ribosomal protein L6 [Gammaproteobacteria bacterium]